MDNSWKLQIVQFMDDVRRGEYSVQNEPEFAKADERIEALAASSVEALCIERGEPLPEWTRHVPALKTPWFVAGMETLKAIALVESPVCFRRRNIFVMSNFMSRV